MFMDYEMRMKAWDQGLGSLFLVKNEMIFNCMQKIYHITQNHDLVGFI